MRRWKVIEWGDRPERRRTIEPVCPACGWDGELEIGDTPGGQVIATIGLGVIFDPPAYVPPPNLLPDAIRCGGCRRIWATSPRGK